MNEAVKNAKPVPPIPRPDKPAHVVRADFEAIDIAQRLAANFAERAAIRDATREWPVRELDLYSQSGLWSLNVPRRFDGPELSYATIARVTEIISAADSSIGQIAQNHIGVVAAIRTVSDEAQQALLFGEVLRGARFGNAFSEFGSKRAAEFETKFEDRGDHVVVTGKKFYATGALLAHLTPIVAVDDRGRAWYAIADRGAEGLSVIDDWSSFGQRTTLSGTVLLDHVRVPKSHLVPGFKGYDKPTADGAIFQIIQVAVDSAAQALTEKAGKAIDAAVAGPTAENVAYAQIVTAEAKVLPTEVAIEATNKLFELAGTRSTLAEHHLDRHWRNARTHTLHDPVRWKYAILGDYFLNGKNPPLHAWS
jgi:alkylation response protein AidB-like acyl-CoA dehydrogenase